MATYITLINFTEQGVRDVKDTANRASHYKELAAKTGCTIKEIWWTQGQYDVVSVIEAPDDASATTLAMSVGKLGTQTLRAFVVGPRGAKGRASPDSRASSLRRRKIVLSRSPNAAAWIR